VLRQAQAIGLDPAYVYGLIRQESRFIMDARSHVGASGLMQIMPATARWTARKIGLTASCPPCSATGHQHPDRHQLPQAGAGRFAAPCRWPPPPTTPARAARALAQRPGAGRRHLGRERALAETRDYVKKVLSNTVDYALLLGEPRTSLQARLGRIGPAPSEETALTRDLP
jgi:soluble lytic murein transglycosylase